jgi:hypothetical protein
MRLHTLLPLVLLCVSCDFLGRNLARFIPALEKTNEDWAPAQMDCESTIPTQRPTSCVAGRIACGDIVEGYSGAGDKRWNDTFWRGNRCTTIAGGYGKAPEMTYRLKLPPNTRAVVKLVSDCVDLDVFGMRWEEKGTCPANRHAERIAECEMDDSPRGGAISLNSTTKPITYLVGVDGKKGAIGNYRLSVQCQKGR